MKKHRMNALPNRQFRHLTIEQWQSYVESHPASLIFHHRNWIELLSEQYGFEAQIPAIENNGQICAAFPFLQTRGVFGKRKLVSLPFSDYLPVLASEPSTLRFLCEQIAINARHRFHAIVIRANTPIASLPSDSHNVLHSLPTNRSLSEIESDFASAITRNLRKCQREKLQFGKRSDVEAVDEFYRLHVLTRRKLGVPVQSKSYFRRLWEKMIKPGFGFVGIVSKQNAPIAAGVFLHFNGSLVYKYAASDPAALELRPNDWLIYSAVREAVEQGYHILDFGISNRNQEGLRRFKKKWGAIESDILYSYVLGKPSENAESSRAVRLAAEVIKRSPTAVCRVLGATFYRYSQ